MSLQPRRLLALLAWAPSTVQASIFVDEEAVQRALLEEVDAALHYGTDDRLQSFEDGLYNLFQALPKNVHGNLGHTTARFALHRLFVERHGWYIKGMHPRSEPVNESEAGSILKDRVPSYLQGLFELHLDGKGFSLQHLSVYAAALDHLVRDEALARLELAYGDLNLDPKDVDGLRGKQVDAILDRYMQHFRAGGAGAGSMEDAVHFAHSLRRSMELAATERTNHFVQQTYDFWSVGDLAEEVGKRFGHFQNSECKRIKEHLVEHDRAGTGRIPLRQFYKLGTSMPGHFQETQAYLRKVGVLDESASEPSVVIPNYVLSPSNCAASSAQSFYSVCCIDECESKLVHLENAVAGPEATPAQLMELLSSMSSEHVSSSLRARLEAIASHHDGLVPLHGRLFAQWLHHVFPRDCPFPSAQAEAAMTPDEWLEETGESCFAPMPEVEHFASVAHVGHAAELPWSSHEQLFVARLAPGELRAHQAKGVLRKLMQVTVLITSIGSFAATLWHTIPKLTRRSRKLSRQEDDLLRAFV